MSLSTSTSISNMTKEQIARQLALSQAREKDIEAKLNRALEASKTPAAVISLADLAKVLLGAGDTPLDPLDLLARLGVKVPTSFSVTVNFTVSGRDMRIFENDITNWELQDALLVPISDRPILSKDLVFTDFNVVVVNPIEPKEEPKAVTFPQPSPTSAKVAATPRPDSPAAQWAAIQEGK